MPDTPSQSQETELLLLRKLPCSGRAILWKGLSPEDGQLAFLSYDSGQSGKRTLPELEVFRQVRITTEPGRGELQHIVTADILEDFTGVAADYEAFRSASWLAGFSLLNVMPGIAHPLFHRAVCVALRRLKNPAPPLCPDAILSGAALTFLFEEGWLESMLELPKAQQLRTILEMAAGKDAPAFTRESWAKFFAWCTKILLQNDCRLPC